MTEQAPSKNYERELGGIQERLKAMDEGQTTLQEHITVMQKDIREMRDIVVGVKGGWKTISIIVAVSATVGAVAAKLAPLLAYFANR